MISPLVSQHMLYTDGGLVQQSDGPEGKIVGGVLGGLLGGALGYAAATGRCPICQSVLAVADAVSAFA